MREPQTYYSVQCCQVGSLGGHNEYQGKSPVCVPFTTASFPMVIPVPDLSCFMFCIPCMCGVICFVAPVSPIHTHGSLRSSATEGKAIFFLMAIHNNSPMGSMSPSSTAALLCSLPSIHGGLYHFGCLLELSGQFQQFASMCPIFPQWLHCLHLFLLPLPMFLLCGQSATLCPT